MLTIRFEKKSNTSIIFQNFGCFLGHQQRRRDHNGMLDIQSECCWRNYVSSLATSGMWKCLEAFFGAAQVQASPVRDWNCRRDWSPPFTSRAHWKVFSNVSSDVSNATDDRSTRKVVAMTDKNVKDNTERRNKSREGALVSRKTEVKIWTRWVFRSIRRPGLLSTNW